jgi:altronate dehydratase
MLRTLAGYAVHPLARRTLMLEHGCEKTHNDAFRNILSPEQIARLGWLSIQMDGGIESVMRKALDWFHGAPGVPHEREPAPISDLRVAFAATGDCLPASISDLAQSLAASGALVVLPECESAKIQADPTIDYGQPAPSHGLHVMRTPTRDFTEILTGLGATGAELIVIWNTGPSVQSHPFIPTLEVRPTMFSAPEKTVDELLALIVRAASGERPAASQAYADFQITRGLEGVSL